jgi:hypothetical protein
MAGLALGCAARHNKWALFGAMMAPGDLSITG